jgi:hypothetical protein
LKVVLLLGAGATVSDVATKSLKIRPPLDRGFFRVAKTTSPGRAREIAAYMSKVYESDIFARDEDSLERVMGQIYTDTFNPGLEGCLQDAGSLPVPWRRPAGHNDHHLQPGSAG